MKCYLILVYTIIIHTMNNSEIVQGHLYIILLQLSCLSISTLTTVLLCAQMDNIWFATPRYWGCLLNGKHKSSMNSRIFLTRLSCEIVCLFVKDTRVSVLSRLKHTHSKTQFSAISFLTPHYLHRGLVINSEHLHMIFPDGSLL